MIYASLVRVDATGVNLEQALAASEMIAHYCNGTLALQPSRRRNYRNRGGDLKLVRPAASVTLVEIASGRGGPWTTLAQAEWSYDPAAQVIAFGTAFTEPYVRITTAMDGFGRFEAYAPDARTSVDVTLHAVDKDEESVTIAVASGSLPSDVTVKPGDVIVAGDGLVMAREALTLSQGNRECWAAFNVDGSADPAAQGAPVLRRWIPPAPLEDAASVLANRIAGRDGGSALVGRAPDGTFTALFSDLRRQLAPFRVNRI